MKTLTILSVLLSSAAAFAVTPAQMTGKFTDPKEIAIIGYRDAASCTADHGIWNEDFCVFRAEDRLDVTSKGGRFKISVETISTNAHTCSFEAPALRDGNRLVASVKAENFEGGKWVDAICTVTVSYKSKDAVSVDTNGKCQSFCGARGLMEFSAKRK